MSRQTHKDRRRVIEPRIGRNVHKDRRPDLPRSVLFKLCNRGIIQWQTLPHPADPFRCHLEP